MKEKIKSIIAETLELETDVISDDSKVMDIPEWDSMMFVLILSELQEQLGITIPIDDALEIETVSDFYKFL